MRAFDVANGAPQNAGRIFEKDVGLVRSSFDLTSSRSKEELAMKPKKGQENSSLLNMRFLLLSVMLALLSA